MNNNTIVLMIDKRYFSMDNENEDIIITQYNFCDDPINHLGMTFLNNLDDNIDDIIITRFVYDKNIKIYNLPYNLKSITIHDAYCYDILYKKSSEEIKKDLIFNCFKIPFGCEFKINKIN